MTSIPLSILITILIAYVESNVIYSRNSTDQEDLSKNMTAEECHGLVEVELNNMNENFGNMQNQFKDHQAKIFNDAKDNIIGFKNYRDLEVNILKEDIKDLNGSYRVNMKKLESKKLRLEEGIKILENNAKNEYLNTLEEDRVAENDYKVKIKKLESRKKVLKDLRECDDCDDFIGQFTVDTELAKTQEEILKLKSKFLQKAGGTEEIFSFLSHEKLVELSVKYSQLVDILWNQLDEVNKLKEINVRNLNVIQRYKEYSENIDLLFSQIEEHILTQKKFYEHIESDSEALPNLDMKSMSLSQENINTTHQWMRLDEDVTELPENAIIGGNDVDGAPLYLIRFKHDATYLYGKFVFSNDRKNAYVTNNESEFGVDRFELLTAKNHKWCNFDTTKEHNIEYPICRANLSNSTIPGTFLEDKSCRIGFGWRTRKITQNFQTFSLDSCDITK